MTCVRAEQRDVGTFERGGGVEVGEAFMRCRHRIFKSWGEGEGERRNGLAGGGAAARPGRF